MRLIVAIFIPSLLVVTNGRALAGKSLPGPAIFLDWLDPSRALGPLCAEPVQHGPENSAGSAGLMPETLR